MKFIDLTGEKFSNLTVINRRNKNNRHNKVIWNCICDCGIKITAIGMSLKSGSTKSCGCLRKHKIYVRSYESKGKRRLIRLYAVWGAMKHRCSCKTDARYLSYGGRGISVCKEWLSFDNFRNWAITNGYRKNLTIDRINNDSGYSPDNCQWISNFEQHANTRRNHKITFNGEIKHLSAWARDIGISDSALSERLKKWTIEKSLTMPVNKQMQEKALCATKTL